MKQLLFLFLCITLATQLCSLGAGGRVGLSPGVRSKQ